MINKPLAHTELLELESEDLKEIAVNILHYSIINIRNTVRTLENQSILLMTDSIHNLPSILMGDRLEKNKNFYVSEMLLAVKHCILLEYMRNSVSFIDSIFGNKITKDAKVELVNLLSIKK